MSLIIYDKDNNKIPSREFLSMFIILLKKSRHETGCESLIEWLESLEERDENMDTDVDDDDSLRKAISKILKENYDNE